MSNDDEHVSAATNNITEQQQQQQPKPWASLADRLNPNRAAFDPELKTQWKTMSKAERNRLLREDQTKIQALKARGNQVLPFPAEDDDHCETSPTAYAHIAPLLQLIAKQLHKEPKDLRIYDPYYCAGGMVQHLQALGFHQVHNVAEDFYQVIADRRIPPHDVVLTNPPYSGDHFDRLLSFLTFNGTPFLLLLPSHFVKRPAYRDAARLQEDLVFVTPPERYHYWTPEGRRPAEDKKKRKHRNLHLGSRNSPFCSHWFVSLAPLLSRTKLLKLETGQPGGLGLPEGCTLHGEVLTVQGSEQTFRGDNGASDAATTDESSERKKKRRRKKKKHKDRPEVDGDED